MKHLLITLLVFLISTPVMATPTQKHDIVVKINGMVCDVCAQSVKKTFLKENTVKDVTIDLDAGTVMIDLNDKAVLDDDTIKKLVDYSGYDIVTITR